MEWLSIYLVSSNASILPNPNLEFFLFYTTGVLSALFHLIFKKKKLTQIRLSFSAVKHKKRMCKHIARRTIHLKITNFFVIYPRREAT